MATLAPCESMQIFIDAVKQKMAADGVSVSELARRTGIKQPSMSRILTGNQGSANLATCDTIATALGTTTVKLLSSR